MWTGAQCTTTHGDMVWHNLWALVIILICIILNYTIPLRYIVLLYIMYSQIFIFSLYCDKILGKKQFKAGRVCLAHSRGVHDRGRAWQQESGWSHCIHSREPEGTGSGAWLSDLKAHPLFTSMIKNLPIQGHHLGTKCSNIQDYWGHYTFKPEQEEGGRQGRAVGRARDHAIFLPLMALEGL